MAHDCTCPPSGAFLCPRCRLLLRRAEGGPATPAALTETRFLAIVRAMATQTGWLTYHVWNARKSEPGFCDLVVAKPGQPVLLAELKTTAGRLTLPQQRWHAVLQQCDRLENYVWRPGDLADIVALLTRS